MKYKNLLFADMHTHSKYSHDSVCEIEDMCLAEIEKGIKVMAVTDHCDVFSYCDYDIYTPIKKAYKTVETMNKKYGDKLLVLSGVEISEGFWFPEEYKKIYNLVPYDVVIGSVHVVRYKDITEAYSRLNFAQFSEEDIYGYLDAYFDDVLTMLDKTEFDILAHLTCPIRYISGKYEIELDMKRFEDKIEMILKRIIARDIALEINTSGYDMLNDFLPGRDTIKKYKSLGGGLITLGSDAHVVERAALHFEKAIEFLKGEGFETICYFKKRNIVEVKI